VSKNTLHFDELRVFKSKGILRQPNTYLDLQANEQFEVVFDGSSLPSGIYIVRMVSAGQVKNLKLMIKK
jgi:hypothetical protein